MTSTQNIVLGSDSGAFWQGGDTWTDDPSEAKTFNNPRDAWQQAARLQLDQAEYLEDSAVELHLRDSDEPRLTRRVTSLADQNNRPALRRQWRTNFGEALPPDLPSHLQGDELYRLEDFLSDVDWDALRVRHDAPDKMYAALDSGFRVALKQAAASDKGPVSRILQELVPRDVSDAMQSDWTRSSPQASASPLPSEDSGVEHNEISRDRARENTSINAPSPAPMSTSHTDAPGDSRAKTSDDQLPEFVRRHFVRSGDEFFYRQTPDKLAFETRGETFRAHDSSVSVATAMVEMAEAQGWSALKVKGSKDFRRLVWAAAAKRGLSVDGYSPSAGERAVLEQETASRPHRGDLSDSRVNGRQRERPTDPLAGILMDHGPAPYQNQQENSPSYFVSLRSDTGKVTTHWGLDLERALDETSAEVGDQVQLARLGKQRVQIQEPVKDQQGNVVDHVTKETERNSWSVTVLSRSDRSDDAQRGQRTEAEAGARADPIAAKVVELFTTERLGRLPPEDQARFRELYDQARARLDSREIPTPDHEDRPDRNVVSRDRHRERAAQGR